MSVEDKIKEAERVALIRKHFNDCEWWHRPSVCTCLLSGHNTAVIQTFKDIRAAISALESIPVWVKCSERLPEVDGSMLIYDGEEVGEGRYSSARGFRWGVGNLAAKAIAYMPLPAPPKVEEA